MKSYQIAILTIILSVMVTSSCKKNVALTPLSFEPTSFTTAAQLTGQLAACYNTLEQDALYGQGLWGYLESGTDETFRTDASASFLTEQLYNTSATDANISLFWRNLYIGVERCNVLLSVVDQPTMDETLRAQIKGQARFLRAYYFYLLVSHFGDVPLKTTLTTTEGSNFQLPRNPAKDVYNYIIAEMTAAEPMVQTMAQAQTTTVVTQTGVDAMLARVCLTMAGNPVNDQTQYKAALGWAQKVISSGVHALNATPLAAAPGTTAYARLFINNMQDNVNDKNITEGIFDAAFLSKSSSSGTYASLSYPVTQQLGALEGVYDPSAIATAVVGYSSGTYRVLPKLYNLYGAGDLRRDWIASPYLYKDATTTRYYSLQVILTGGGGTGAVATAYTNSIGAITSIRIENPGSGYTSAPAISFSSYSTTNTIAQLVTGVNVATATATVSGGQVTGITVTKAGLGYPTIYDLCAGKWRREYEVGLPPTRQQNYTSCDFPIVRYADVLLMAAEADLNVNGSPSAQAVEYLNQVRRRAYGYAPTTAVPGFDKTTFTLQDIMDERARELCFEGQRRNDLIRWGVMSTVMQALAANNANNAPTSYLTPANLSPNNFLSNPGKYLLFPIPATELPLDNALTQNPGW